MTPKKQKYSYHAGGPPRVSPLPGDISLCAMGSPRLCLQLVRSVSDVSAPTELLSSSTPSFPLLLVHYPSTSSSWCGAVFSASSCGVGTGADATVARRRFPDAGAMESGRGIFSGRWIPGFLFALVYAYFRHPRLLETNVHTNADVTRVTYLS